MAHRDLVESTMATWIAARTEAEVLDAFAQAEAAVAPVMTMADVAADPHVSARGMVAEVGGVPMQGLVARLTATPGVLRWAGPSLDADGPAIRADQVAGGDGWGGVSPA
jgi:crotonobetainyl-CoA:carnitine CoA-transferase CaiB-like acyl-CoA transferase